MTLHVFRYSKPPRRRLSTASRGRRGGRARPVTGAGDHGDHGQVSAFVVILLTALFAMAGLVLDTGLALSDKAQALDAAQAAARAGAQELDLAALHGSGALRLDPARASAAARAWLATTGHTGTATATPAAVTVTVHAARDTQLLQLIGVRQLRVSATATATPTSGPDTGAGP